MSRRPRVLPLVALLCAWLVALPSCTRQPVEREAPPAHAPEPSPAPAPPAAGAEPVPRLTVLPKEDPARVPIRPTTRVNAAELLAELAKEYQALGLPLPPEKGRLVRYEGGTVVFSDGARHTQYGLAFEIEPGTKAGESVLLCGAQELQWNPRRREQKPDPAAVEGINLDADDALALAIQCHARGWDALAGVLLERSREGNGNGPLQKRLVALAWDYWVSRVTHPTADRAPVAQRLRDLIEREPDLDLELHRELVRWLELTLVPSRAAPGSVEALIDALVDSKGNTDYVAPAHGEAYWGIVERGFDAVPALIEHLEDDRLTRAVVLVGGRVTAKWFFPLRVGDVVNHLLESLAAGELTRERHGVIVGDGALQRVQTPSITRTAAVEWFEKARKVGEETYFLDRVLTNPKSELGYVNPHVLCVLAAKFPLSVPAVYRTVLDKYPNLNSAPLAAALTRCSLPVKDKLDFLLTAARHEKYVHTRPAFRAIRELDQKRFDALLLATIEGLRVGALDKYWTCPGAHLAGLAVESDEPRVWPTLTAVAGRAPVGLRMELLSLFDNPRDTRHRAERLRFLANFLNDSAVRDVKVDSRLDGRNAGDWYERIEVRDFVAIQLVSLLEIRVEVKPDRTPAEWAALRDKVREALKRELDGAK